MAGSQRNYRPGIGGISSALWVAVIVATTFILATIFPRAERPPTDTFIELYSSGLVVNDNGTREPLPADADSYPPLSSTDINWLAEGTIPGTGTRAQDMAQRALLDIRALMLPVDTPEGNTPTQRPQRYALVAGWEKPWRYVWPRDSAFAVSALARAGHTDQAWGILAFLQDVQAPDGTFEARYLPAAGGHVPDARATQPDAVGWVLWAANELIANAPAGQQAEIRNHLEPLISRATTAALRLTKHGRALPPVASDYWEITEYRVTLGNAASMLVALDAATSLGETNAQAGAQRYRALLEATFGTQHYPRHRGWLGSLGATATDTAVSFLRAPFTTQEPAGVTQAWQSSIAAMRRPAGGLAPGGSWRQDGISWTPTTSIYAIVAACNADTDQAWQWLDWLNEHRTKPGSLPEKVLSDGSPAAVAPLAWTSANVIIALDCLAQVG